MILLTFEEASIGDELSVMLNDTILLIRIFFGVTLLASLSFSADPDKFVSRILTCFSLTAPSLAFADSLAKSGSVDYITTDLA